MTMMTSAIPGPTPGATLKQGAAATILGFMGLIFFSIALAAVALQRVALPTDAAADAARLQSWAPAALAVAIGHVIVAVLVVAVSSKPRAIAAAVSAATAIGFAAGAVAVASGWKIFAKADGSTQFAAEGVAIFAVAALIARSRPN